MLVTKQLLVAIDFCSMGRKNKNTIEVNYYIQMFGYQHSPKYRSVKLQYYNTYEVLTKRPERVCK